MIEYIVFAALVFSIAFSLMIYYNKSIGLKIVTVAALFFLSNLLYFSFETYKGWPSEQSLPKKGKLISSMVDEPSENYSGSIYLWISYEAEHGFFQRIFNYRYAYSEAPRGYRIRYDKSLSKRLQQAKEAAQNGFVVEIEMLKKRGSSFDNASETEQYDIPEITFVDPRDINRKDQ